MNEYRIRADIPMPKRGAARYPAIDFSSMKVGSCIITTLTRIGWLRGKAEEFKKLNPGGWAFEQRAILIDGTKSVGLWCTARPDDEAAAPPSPAKTAVTERGTEPPVDNVVTQKKRVRPKKINATPTPRVHEIPKHLLPAGGRRVISGSRY